MKRLWLALFSSGVLMASAQNPAPALAAQGLLLLSEAPKIRSIAIDGNVRFSDGVLERQMISRMPPWWLKLFRTPRLYRGQVDQDVQSILFFYRSRGYLRAQVRSEVVKTGDAVDLNLHVTEGAPIVIDDVDVRGMADGARASLVRNVKGRPGEPLSPYELDQDRIGIEGFLADRGRPYGRVEDNVQFAGDSAFVAFLVDPGPLVRIGDVRLEGASGIDTVGLAREVTVHAGDRFSRQQLTKTRQRLYDTGLFSDVTPRFPEEPDTVVDVTFELRKRKQNWFGAGIGYSNVNGSFVRVSEEWGTRNIFGTGRRFSVSAHSSHAILNPDRTLLALGEGSADAAWYEPWLLGTRVRGKLTGFYRYDNVINRSVKQTTYGSTAELSHELKVRRTNVALQFEARWVRNVIEANRDTICAQDPTLCRERYRTRLGSLRFAYDDRDNFLNPRRGGRHDMLVQFAGGPLGGDNNFQKDVVGSSSHRLVGTNSVLSTRIRLGTIFASDPVPIEDRFLTGGASSVRGYQENTINGLPDGADPSGGGVVQLLANAELRFAIRGSLGGVLFVDAGNVWRDFDHVHPRHLLPTFSSSKTELEDVRWSVGGGVRFNTPVGPVRLESAVRLSPMKSDLTQRIHFALGQTF